jgi:hypothetical protein
MLNETNDSAITAITHPAIPTQTVFCMTTNQLKMNLKQGHESQL